MISPLAQEILDDLPDEFPDGATKTALREWLGESGVRVKSALAELLADRLVHRDGYRYLVGANPISPHCRFHEPETVRRLLADKHNGTYAAVGRRLSIDPKAVKRIALGRGAG